MPLIIESNHKLPVFEELKNESVFIIDKSKAEHQDIRPLRIGLLNLMPASVRTNTEIQFFRLLGNTPLQIEPFLIKFDHFTPKTGRDRLLQFYKPFSEIKEGGLDGLIITGANLELDKEKKRLLDFSDIFYSDEFLDLISWAEKYITSTLYSCLASHFALSHFHNLERKLNSKKTFGVFNHKVNRNLFSELTKGMNDIVPGVHSRWGSILTEDLSGISNIKVLIENEQTGWYVAIGDEGREVYVQGHPEYDREDLANEYYRDKEQGQSIPYNYFPNDDDRQMPICNWRADAAIFFKNWVNFIYQKTGYGFHEALMNE